MRTTLSRTATRHAERRDPWRQALGAEGHRPAPPWILIPRRRQPLIAGEPTDLGTTSAAGQRALADV
jgi:hypothetical protein